MTWSCKIKEGDDFFAWDNVSVVTESSEYLLSEVSGRVVSGRVTAVMGLSGSGKSTLFNVLSGHQMQGLKVTKKIIYNGAELTQDKQLLSLIEYKFQNSPKFHNLTIFETLMFSSSNFGGTYEEKKERIIDLIYKFNLSRHKDKYLSELSGGQLERVNIIGTLLVEDSKVLLFDEALSKLDSYVLRIAMKEIIRAVKNNKIVIIALHQPSKEINNMIDDLILMSDGGVVYHGKYSLVRKYFTSLGCTMTDNYCNEMMYLLSNRANSKNNTRAIELKSKFRPDYIFSLITDDNKTYKPIHTSSISLITLMEYFTMDIFRNIWVNHKWKYMFSFLIAILYSNFLSIIRFAYPLIAKSENIVFVFLKTLLLIRDENYLNTAAVFGMFNENYFDYKLIGEPTTDYSNLFSLSSIYNQRFGFLLNSTAVKFGMMGLLGYFIRYMLKRLIVQNILKTSISSLTMLVFLYKSGKFSFIKLYFTLAFVIVIFNMLMFPLFDLFGVNSFIINEKTSIVYGILINYLNLIIFSFDMVSSTCLGTILNPLLSPTASRFNFMQLITGSFLFFLFLFAPFFSNFILVESQNIRSNFLFFIITTFYKEAAGWINYQNILICTPKVALASTLFFILKAIPICLAYIFDLYNLGIFSK